MTRVAALAVVASLAVCAGPARSDPSFPVPPAGAPGATQTETTPAQAAPPSGDDTRYSFHRIGDGFVRLDSRTGDLSQCGWTAGSWSCKVVPDERAALDSEIARLQRENAALKKAMLSKGLELPSGVPPELQQRSQAAPVPPARVPDATPQQPKGPSEPDLDRAIGYVKKVWRKLVDMMIDLQRDIQRKS